MSGTGNQPGVVGNRLPTPPRERKPALAALAVLLILVGALGTTMLVIRAGDRIEVVRITEPVPAGQHVPKSAIEPVMVAADDAMKYVEYDQRGLLQSKYRTTTPLVKGTLLVGPMLTTKAGIDDGMVVVGLSLKSGQYPSELKGGDTVAAYRVGDAAASDETPAPGAGDAVLAPKATVLDLKDKGEGSLSSDQPVSLLVEQGEAAALTKAASQGAVALVIVPSGS